LINKGKENINSSARCPPPFPRSDSSLVRESDSGVREGGGGRGGDSNGDGDGGAGSGAAAVLGGRLVLIVTAAP
jgi:hypothetical protein